MTHRTLTTAQLAEYLQVAPRTILRLRAEGVIRSYRVRTMVRFVLEEVLADLARAERDLPIRRLDGTLLRSGGPRRKEKSRERGRAGANTINLTSEGEENESDDKEGNVR